MLLNMSNLSLLPASTLVMAVSKACLRLLRIQTLSFRQSMATILATRSSTPSKIFDKVPLSSPNLPVLSNVEAHPKRSCGSLQIIVSEQDGTILVTLPIQRSISASLLASLPRLPFPSTIPSLRICAKRGVLRDYPSTTSSLSTAIERYSLVLREDMSPSSSTSYMWCPRWGPMLLFETMI